MKKSELPRIVFLILFLAVVCVLPFIVAPPKDWYIIFIIIGVPTLSILGFGLLASRIRLSSDPKRLWAASYFVIAFAAFCLAAIVFYLSNYSWDSILLCSTGFGLLAIVAAALSTFVWSKIKQSNSTHPE